MFFGGTLEAAIFNVTASERIPLDSRKYIEKTITASFISMGFPNQSLSVNTAFSNL